MVKQQENRIYLGMEEKRKMVKELGCECVYCGNRNYFALTIDHKVPFADGGSEDIENRQLVCAWCNQMKADLNDEEFKEFINSLNRLSEINKLSIDSAFPKFILRAYCPKNHPKCSLYDKKEERN